MWAFLCWAILMVWLFSRSKPVDRRDQLGTCRQKHCPIHRRRDGHSSVDVGERRGSASGVCHGDASLDSEPSRLHRFVVRPITSGSDGEVRCDFPIRERCRPS